MSPTRSHEEARTELFAQDPELKAEYDAMEPAFLLAREVLRARWENRWSQARLALEMGVAQSAVSRIENMEGSPNLRTVLAFARALGRDLELRFVPKDSDDAPPSDEYLRGAKALLLGLMEEDA